METKVISVVVSKELSELGEGVARFLAVLKQEAQDGFDVSDISSILSSAMTDLLPALEGVTLVQDELKQDPVAFTNAAALTGAKIVNALL